MCGVNAPACCIIDVCSTQKYTFSRRGYRSVRLYHFKPLGLLDHYFQCCCAAWYWMNCYDRRLRRTRPEQQNGRDDTIPTSQLSRVNGWSLPLHSFQFIAWLVYSYLAIVGFGIYIPLLPYGWKYAAYAVIGLLFVCHFITHLIAITVDPADPNVLAKKNYCSPMPVFDRSKHKHVIQNLHCYLCEVNVGSKAKHCSACNKCIADFDHHCKWLNNCVGGKNYWFFFNAVVSAVLGTFLVILVILYVFIQHFVNPTELRTASQFERVTANNTWLVFLPIAPVETTAAGILAIAVITVLLAIASVLLLGHLLVFHLYLLGKGMSTYDYMTHQRSTQSTRDNKRNVEVAQIAMDGTTAVQKLSLAGIHKDTDIPISSRSSGLKYQDGGQLSLRQPAGICSETSDVTYFTRLNLNQEMLQRRPESSDCENAFHQIPEHNTTITAVLDANLQEVSHLQLPNEVPSNSIQPLGEFNQESMAFTEVAPSNQNLYRSSTMDRTHMIPSWNVTSHLDTPDQVRNSMEIACTRPQHGSQIKGTAQSKDDRVSATRKSLSTFTRPKHTASFQEESMAD